MIAPIICGTTRPRAAAVYVRFRTDGPAQKGHSHCRLGVHLLARQEGDDRDLAVLWARLACDTRHCRLFRIGDESCSGRLYHTSMMAYLVDPRVDAQIIALRSLQGPLDREFTRGGELAEMRAALPSCT